MKNSKQKLVKKIFLLGLAALSAAQNSLGNCLPVAPIASKQALSPYMQAVSNAGGALTAAIANPAPEAKYTLWQKIKDFYSWDQINERCKWTVENGGNIFLLSIAGVLVSQYCLPKSIFTKSATTSATETSGDTNAQASKPTETFADVAGAAHAKDALQDVKEYLTNPEQYTRLGAKRPKGVLLVGPPGNGKTLLAKALAGETSCHFINIKTADIQNQYVSSGAQNIKNLFSEARTKSPCIIFFDEIDAIGGKRAKNDSNTGEEHNKTLTELLAQIDGFDTGKDQVIVIGATNLPQNLDPALKRRFTQEIQVPNPTQKDRREILGVHAKGKTFATDVDLDAVSRSTIGFSGSDLANLLDLAAVLATKAKKEAIDMTDILEAWQNKILGGAINKTMDLTHDDLEKTAYHEAGHALVTLLNPEILDPLYMVTIEPRGATLGICATLPEREKYAQSKEELLAVIAKCMGGRAAEHVQYKQQYTGVSSDIEKATNIARTMIHTYGMSDLGPAQWGASSTHSPAVQEKIDTQVQAMLENGYQSACTLLEQNKDKLDTLAAKLLEKKTLQAAEIYELLGITPRTCNQLIAGTAEKPESAPAELGVQTGIIAE
jgi:cell division protease FtsH